MVLYNNMDKILIVTDVWTPKVDGIVTSLKKTMEILEKKGIKVIIVHPGLFWTIPLFFYSEIKLSFFSSRKIKKMIKLEQPDYIHIATEGPLGFIARMICVRKNIPFTTSYHTHLPLYAKIRIDMSFSVAYLYLRWFHKQAKTTFVSTKSLKNELELHKFNHLTVAPLGVDSDLFTRNIKSKISTLQKPVFVYFGRIAVEKNVEDFLRCELPGTKLIIGDGPDRAMLENKYGKNNLFIGYKKEQDLVDWLSMCDVFVCPSRTETFGLVILEALSCGIPVAAYKVTGPEDIITNGLDGYLGDNLADSAKKCLTLSTIACREKALLYSWESYVDTFIKNQVKIR